jgi:uncharacterized protein YkwD
MASTRIGVCVAVLLCGLAGPSAAVAAPTSIAAPTSLGGSVPSATLARAVRVTPPQSALPPVLREMSARVNAERESRGLAPMRYDERLALAAQRHSQDQARQGRMSHTGSDGSTLAGRIDDVGYLWRSVAENVAVGYPDVESVMAGWLASDGHRRNILSANVDLGVGLAFGTDGRPYWTQVFASPR